MDNTNRPPSQKSPRARLHRRNKSHGTYIIRWARGRVTMSSSEKVSEKPRENDKPPAYPVTRRRVTHFFFFSFFFPPSPLHFAFPPSIDGVPIIQLWTHSHRRLRVTLRCFPPSTTFLHFYSPLRERLETIEPIITIEYFIWAIPTRENSPSLYVRRKILSLSNY